MTREERGDAETRGKSLPLGLAALAAAALVGWLVFGPDRDDPEPPQPPPSGGTGGQVEQGYVGSRACAACHEQIAEDYAGHPMARSLRRVNEAEPIEVYLDSGKGAATLGEVGFVTGGRTYLAVRHTGQDGQTGEVVHRESMQDARGNMLYTQAETIDFTVGAGVKGRSFLLFRNGRFFESPITWYTQTSSWGLSPGYPPGLHYRFSRRVGDDCLACHAGRVASVPGNDADRYHESRPFAEASIGCERCHGPGREHVALYESTSTQQVTDPRIVNPSGLAGSLQDDVCNQCHLEGKVRVLRQDRRFADYRPGRPLGETWTVFIGDSPFDADGRPLFTSHVEQMHSSACFKGSAGALRCTSCHDPHRVPPANGKASFYNARCNRCHGEKGCSLPEPERRKPPAAGSCIECHMPRLHSSDISHTTQADHRVVRRASKTGPTEATGQVEHEGPGRPWRPFGNMADSLSPADRRRAEALAWFRQAADTRDPGLLARVRELLEQVVLEDPADVDARGTLGFAWFRSSDLAAARRELERALKDRPDHEPYLSFLGLIAYESEDPSGIKYFRRLLELNPFDGEAHGPFADMLEATGKRDEAIRTAERGLELDPTILDLRRSLARFYRAAGRAADAREQERIASEIAKRLGSP